MADCLKLLTFSKTCEIEIGNRIFWNFCGKTKTRLAENMTEKNDLEVKTKKLIRSVLLCKQEGCPLGKFAHEYQDFTGEPIPFKRLGYISLERCLQSMPDVVDFKKVNGQTILSAVSDNQTKHIDALVKGQRPNTKRAFVRHNGGRQKFSTNQRGQNKVLPFKSSAKSLHLSKITPK